MPNPPIPAPRPAAPPVGYPDLSTLIAPAAGHPFYDQRIESAYTAEQKSANSWGVSALTVAIVGVVFAPAAFAAIVVGVVAWEKADRVYIPAAKAIWATMVGAVMSTVYIKDVMSTVYIKLAQYAVEVWLRLRQDGSLFEIASDDSLTASLLLVLGGL